MKIALLTLSISTLTLTACSNPEPQKSPIHSIFEQNNIQQKSNSASSASTFTLEDTTETSLDWQGQYKGILPCADCEGIATKIQLHSDQTYELTEKYLGKSNDQVSKIKGTFQFDQTQTSMITLDSAGNNRKFFVAENYIESRNLTTGEKIDGPLAEHYILKKYP